MSSSGDTQARILALRGRNRARWDELVPIHLNSEFYGLDRFRQGRVALCPIELEELGDIRGKRILHLLCHFGLGTLSLARLGSLPTGVDYSEVAIRQARQLASEAQLPAEFVCSDVYDLPAVLTGAFDIVFASYGVLIWLDDLDLWAKTVAHFLAPGGFFYLVDEHPFALVCRGEGAVENLRFAHSYFDEPEPVRFEVRGSYADREAHVANTEVFSWIHSLSNVVNSLIRAGLRIEFLHEFPFSVYQMFPGMAPGEEGRWTLPGPRSLPFLFSVKASKPARPAPAGEGTREA